MSAFKTKITHDSEPTTTTSLPSSESNLSNATSFEDNADNEAIPSPSLTEDPETLAVETSLLRLYDTCTDISNHVRLSLLSASNDQVNIRGTTAAFAKQLQPHPRLPPSPPEPHAFPCRETHSPIPLSPPSQWPQRPMLLRPTPDAGMTILGIRYSSSESATGYLPLPGTGFCLGCTLPVNNGREARGKCLVVDFESELFIGTVMLRIKNLRGAFEDDNNRETNGGTGTAGGSDDVTGTTEKKSSTKTGKEDNKGNYFHKRKRTFQAIVRGHFKQPNIPMSECITGQIFNKPAGKLPPRIVVKGAVSVISHLAPQLQARLDGDCPRFLSPLVSTAQSVIARREATMEKKNDNSKDNDDDDHNDKNDDATNNCNDEKSTQNHESQSLEDGIHEPQPSNPTSLLQNVIHSGAASKAGISTTLPPDTDNAATRTRHRKRAFDKLFAKSVKIPVFDTETEYTFEFFQHLISFEDFALDFVRPVGKQPLSGVLNGQPLKFMAGHQVKEKKDKEDGNGKLEDEEEKEEVIKWLWSFDLWHESLYDDAVAAV